MVKVTEKDVKESGKTLSASGFYGKCMAGYVSSSDSDASSDEETLPIVDIRPDDSITITVGDSSGTKERQQW